MQLKSLARGRFASTWQQHQPRIEQVVHACVTGHRQFQRLEKLLTQGEQVEHLYLIPSGRIAMGMMARNGRNFLLGTLQCDQHIFGEMEFFTGYPCQMNIVAQETLEAAIISAPKLQQCLLEEPGLSLGFASAVALDYQDTMEILARRMLHPISYNLAYDIYHQHLNNLPVDGFEHNYLEAERFATTDRVYRRAVKELEAKGLIARDKSGLRIINLEGLKQFIQD